MINCDTNPVAAITVKIVITVITDTGIRTGFSTFHDDIRPTPAGINKTGMISMRNLPASFTRSS